MTKINFDETNLSMFVNKGLESSISNLKKAVSISSVLSIPYEFKYRSYLKSLDDNLKETLGDISNVYNSVKNSSTAYSYITDEVNSKVTEVENYTISLRQSAIK